MAPSLAPVATVLDKSLLGGNGGQPQLHSQNAASHAFFGKAAFDLGNSSNADTAYDAMALLLNDSQSQRSAVVVLSALGLAGCLLILYSILYDTFRVRSGEIYSRAQKRSGFMTMVHPAEVFPFILALATLLQTCVFLAVQGGGLSSFWVDGCRGSSQRLWPALWSVVLTILAYGIETTLRSLQRSRFGPRSLWTTPACIVAVALSLLGLWLISFLMPSLDVCPGSLIWWTYHYSKIGAVLAPLMLFASLLCGFIITVQLLKTIDMDRAERIAASRVVYSLAVNVLILLLVFPYWIQSVIGVFPVQSSGVASISLSLTGLILAILHFLLRCNAERYAIRPKNAPWPTSKSFRFFGANDLASKMFISTPLLQKEELFRDHWNDNAKAEKFEAAAAAAAVAPSNLDSRSSWPPIRITQSNGPSYLPAGVPASPSPQQPPMVAQAGRARSKSSYSIFPSQTPRRPTLASLSINQPFPDGEEMILLPNPAFSQSHERQGSTMTSATVEIGFRLSDAMSDSMELQQDTEAGNETQDLRYANVDPATSPRRSSSVPITGLGLPKRGSLTVLRPLPPRVSSRAAAAPWLDAQSRQAALNNMKILPPVPPICTDRDLLPSSLRSHPMTLPSSPPTPKKSPEDWI